MGVRPYMCVVFGATEKPGELPDDETFYEMMVSDWLSFGEGENLISDLLYIGEHESNVSNVYGYIVDQLGDSDVLRGMMLCHPEIFGIDSSGEGWKEFPVFQDEYVRSLYRRRDPMPDDNYEAIPDNQMYSGGYSGYIGMYRRATKKLFDAMGWEYNADEWKLMLVWGWR